VADVLGLPINEKLTLDASITNFSQLPNKTETFVIDQVVTYLKKEVAMPSMEGWEDAKAANKAIAAIAQEFNALA
jgi:hypothetical protein